MSYKKYGLVLAIALTFFANVQAALLQQPIQSSSAEIPPNIVFTLDDSGSMAFECLPDDLCIGNQRVGVLPIAVADWKNGAATYNLNEKVSCNKYENVYEWKYTSINKNYSNQINGIWGVDESGSYYELEYKNKRFYKKGTNLQYSGTVYKREWVSSGLKCVDPDAKVSRDLFPMQLRAPAINPLYFNPSVQYKPWRKADGGDVPGGRYPTYPANRARLYPEKDNDTSVFDLANMNSYSFVWCTSKNNCANNRTTQNVKLAQYFNFNGDPNNPLHVADQSRYEQVLITDPDMLQNFSNWFSYHRDRMRVAIAGTLEAFDAVPNEYRVGYGRINKSNATDIDGKSLNTLERGVRRFIGADKKAFFDWLVKETPKQGGTPLRRAMNSVGQYYSYEDNRGPWGKEPGKNNNDKKISCRRAFHVLMTDGMWNGSDVSGIGNVDNSNGPEILGPKDQRYQYKPNEKENNIYKDSYSGTLADIAMYYWNRDLAPNINNDLKANNSNPAFWQHMVNYTISFGINGKLNPNTDLAKIADGRESWPKPVGDEVTTIDDLWHAAVNSRGRYLSANNTYEYSNAITQILREIESVNASEAGVGVSARVLETNSDNLKFEAEFTSDNWSGDLKAIEFTKIVDDQLVLDDIGTVKWSAAQALPSSEERKIYIYDPSNDGIAKEFDWAKLSPATQALIEPDPALGADLVKYLRGSREFEGTGLYRKRDEKSLLGDIVNSTPIWVGDLVNSQYFYLPKNQQSSLKAAAESYYEFLNAKKKRTGQVLVGANDGMLHVFSEDDGKEKFAYIPAGVVEKIKILSSQNYSHQYFVDGPLVEADIFDARSSEKKWHNIVYGTTGAGAKSIFAVNMPMTDEDMPQVLWNVSAESSGNAIFAEDLGHVMSKVETGVLKDGTWVVIFGNGYNSLNRKAKLFVLNAMTGDVIKVIDTGVGDESSPNGLGGVRVIRDTSQRIVAAYAGDIRGNLWKFDFSSAQQNDWGVAFGGRPLYSTPNNEPIFATPAYELHPVSGVMIVFGTGKAFEVGDIQDISARAVYGVWDRVAVGKSSSNTADAINGQTGIVAQRFESQPLANASGVFYQLKVTPLDYGSDRGWRLPLTIATGQRVVDVPEVVGGLMFVQTMSPNKMLESCSAASVLRHGMLLDPFMNSIAQARFDTNGDKKVDASDDLLSSVVELNGSGHGTMVRERGTNRFHIIQARTAGKLNPVGQGLDGNMRRNWRMLLRTGD